MKLYIDIETVPAQSEETRLAIMDGVKPPAQYKKEESIAAWLEEHGAAAYEEQYRKTALDGAKGHVVCIGVAVNDEEPYVFYDNNWLGNEQAVLRRFFAYLTDMARLHNGRLPTFIGHNILDFDLRFLFHRAVVLGEKPSPYFLINPSQYSDRVYDTMRQWAGYRGYIGLDGICKALGIPGKGDMDGSQVWDYVRDGRIAEVAEYCKDDVTRVREIHKRMTFS